MGRVEPGLAECAETPGGPRVSAALARLLCGGPGSIARVTGRSFPLTPRSTAKIESGDFWSVPLRRGGWFGCGRVLQLLDSRVLLVVGLLDWCESQPPSAESIAGAPVLAVGSVNIKAIELTGGALLGHRDLGLDGGLPRLLVSMPGALSDPPVWGYLSIEDKAHDAFGRHFPENPNPATERPSALRQR